MALPNTWGLLATFMALTICYGVAVWLGHVLAGRPAHLAHSLRSDVVAIVPIALGYHFAHYLTAFLVDAQYAAITLNDPFGQGWDLFGLGHAHVTTSFLTNFASVRLIWHLSDRQHRDRSCRRGGNRAPDRLAEGQSTHCRDHRPAPMTALMIGYTLFGLWLLSAPAIG